MEQVQRCQMAKGLIRQVHESGYILAEESLGALESDLWVER